MIVFYKKKRRVNLHIPGAAIVIRDTTVMVTACLAATYEINVKYITPKRLSFL